MNLLQFFSAYACETLKDCFKQNELPFYGCVQKKLIALFEKNYLVQETTKPLNLQFTYVSDMSIVKVSKFQKQIFLGSFAPKMNAIVFRFLP